MLFRAFPIAVQTARPAGQATPDLNDSRVFGKRPKTEIRNRRAENGRYRCIYS